MYIPNLPRSGLTSVIGDFIFEVLSSLKTVNHIPLTDITVGSLSYLIVDLDNNLLVKELCLLTFRPCIHLLG